VSRLQGRVKRRQEKETRMNFLAIPGVMDKRSAPSVRRMFIETTAGGPSKEGN